MNQRVHGVSAVNDVTGPGSRPRFGQSAQRVRVGLDLQSLALGEVSLDGMHYLLLHTAVIFFGGSAQIGVQVGGKSQCHRHTGTVAIGTTLVHLC